MGDFTATRAYSYTLGALIDPDENNPNENEIYSKYNAAVHATTGHGHTGGTGDGPKLLPTGLNLTSTYAWTGIHTHTADVKMYSGADFVVYSDAGITEKARIDGATGYLGIGVAPSYALDVFGTDTASSSRRSWRRSNDSSAVYDYIYKDRGVGVAGVASDDIGVTHWSSNNDAGVVVDYGRIAVEISNPAAGAHTGIMYLGVATAGVISNKLTIADGWLAVPAQHALYFDGHSNTYLWESVADTMEMVCGGVSLMKWIEGTYDYVEVTAPHGLLLPVCDPPVGITYATRDSINLAKINFQYDGTVRSSYNVDTFTRTGAGRYTIVFDTAMANDDYCAVVSGNQEGGGSTNGLFVGFGSFTTSGLYVEFDDAGGAEDQDGCVIVS